MALESLRDAQPIEGHCPNKSSIHAIALIAPVVRANEQSHGMAVRADAHRVASKRAKSCVVWQMQCEQTSKGLAGTLLALLAAFFRQRRADGGFARLLADVLAKRRVGWTLLVCSQGDDQKKQRSAMATGRRSAKRNETMRRWIIC